MVPPRAPTGAWIARLRSDDVAEPAQRVVIAQAVTLPPTEASAKAATEAAPPSSAPDSAAPTPPAPVKVRQNARSNTRAAANADRKPVVDRKYDSLRKAWGG